MKVGEFIYFSSGEYSDYSVGPICKLLKPITKADWQEMIAACKSDVDWRPFEQGEAVPWFIANGFVEELDATEAHLGDYCGVPEYPWEGEQA